MPQPKAAATADATTIHTTQEIAANIKGRIAELDEYMRLATIERGTLVLALSKLQPESAAISGG